LVKTQKNAKLTVTSNIIILVIFEIIFFFIQAACRKQIIRVRMQQR